MEKDYTYQKYNTFLFFSNLICIRCFFNH